MIDRAREALADNMDAAKHAPHPDKRQADKGKSLADFCAWLLDQNTDRAARRVLALLKGDR